MILNRLGNKTKIAEEIYMHFPKHDIYIEPFFGAGGMFFNKPMAKYNFLNDIDEDVYNLYRQVIDNKEALVEELIRTPITEKQFKEWGKGKRENSDLLNAVRFLVISNFGLYGKANTLRLCAVSPKSQILDVMDETFEKLKTAYLFNSCFRNIFNKVDYKGNKERTFCYCDPPYLDTDDNYSHSFTEQDSADLFDTLEESDIRWAMSEFDHPFILEQAAARNLNILYIGNRQNLMNVRTELLITNYKTPQLKLFQ